MDFRTDWRLTADRSTECDCLPCEQDEESRIVDLKDIKAIIDLMKKNSVSEFELEKQDFKIRLKRGPNGGGAVTAYEEAPSAYAVAQPVAASSPPAQVATGVPAVLLPPAAPEAEIKSPMIGTFYRAPSPESASYVEVGSEVNPDTVVCIIEAMKVMNEIKAEARGVITEVLVENAKPVEFGQLLFKVRPV
jgi:acetyl-CoA carboxylase biotin carboxyl carrier protein